MLGWDTLKSWCTGRSPKWPALERQHLKAHPTCAACGTDEDVEVHHKVPVHVDSSRELDPTNLVTLCCKNCDHFVKGHLCDWSSYNREVEVDAALQLQAVT